jgi:hypothetical protein
MYGDVVYLTADTLYSMDEEEITKQVLQLATDEKLYTSLSDAGKLAKLLPIIADYKIECPSYNYCDLFNVYFAIDLPHSRRLLRQPLGNDEDVFNQAVENYKQFVAPHLEFVIEGEILELVESAPNAAYNQKANYLLTFSYQFVHAFMGWKSAYIAIPNRNEFKIVEGTASNLAAIKRWVQESYKMDNPWRCSRKVFMAVPDGILLA